MRKRNGMVTFFMTGTGIIMKIGTGTSLKIGTGTMMKISTVFQYWPSVHGLETLRTGVRLIGQSLIFCRFFGLVILVFRNLADIIAPFPRDQEFHGPNEFLGATSQLFPSGRHLEAAHGLAVAQSSLSGAEMRRGPS